ncbi:MAG: hypothetical protein ABIH26_15275 [Candidatus Eisenbacteria bacterium]
MRWLFLCGLAAIILLAAAPELVLSAPPAGAAGGEAKLLAALVAAKEGGDMIEARRIERDLAALGGRPFGFGSVVVPLDLGLRAERAPGTPSSGKDRWTDDDILVAGLQASEIRPSMASDSEGNLYVAVEHEGPAEMVIRIYKSENGGAQWNFFYMVSALSDIYKPSIAVGEGGENWLIMVFQHADERILAFHVNLDSTDHNEFTAIEHNVPGVSNPRIATDGTEFEGWYPYVVWNSRDVDNWVLRFTRSLDYGATWETPTTLAGYCGYPDEFYDGGEAYPDIDYGSRYLYVAFDDYSAQCTSTNRDVFAMRSTDYGASWAGAIRLSSEADDEHGPRVGAIKNYLDERNAVVVYTRFWSGIDDDIMYHGTEDGGTTWSAHRCMSCTPVAEERSPDIETSFSEGRFHAAWWQDYNIQYRSAPYADPLAWGDTVKVCEADAAAADFPRPAVGVNPTVSVDEEAGIAWTDFRNAITADDIYYDGPGAVSTGVGERDRVPSVTLLEPVRPNPFNPAAVLRYSLSAPGFALLAVYDVTGRRITVLQDGHHEAGKFETVWSGLDDAGREVPSGVYFARLRAGDYAAAQRVVLVR